MRAPVLEAIIKLGLATHTLPRGSGGGGADGDGESEHNNINNQDTLGYAHRTKITSYKSPTLSLSIPKSGFYRFSRGRGKQVAAS